MRIPRLLGLAFPLFLVAGCVQSHRAPAVVYYAPPPPLAPTSDRPAVRVYPGPTPAVAPVTPPPAPPPGVSAADVGVADAVSQLLKGDSHLAGVSSNVEATVEDGVVTLRGSVPSEHDRYEMVERISQLPGVAHVHDKLRVDLR
ncbi:MAG TPA: BON domain-containing protein [Candidatus Sulfotelmatobacter sp.]|nr:BON domain-containing protein [Candidatus Sulfotelmatobacter sp.]